MAKRLVLFDIDETITYSDGAGRRAVSFALSKLLNVSPEATRISMSGKTDPQILHEILENSGYPLEERDAKFHEWTEIYLGALESEIQKPNTYNLHNGVKEIILHLHDNEDAYLGLLTGNIERGARLKLGLFDLNSYFPIGAYGSDNHDRMALPAIAHARAEEHYCEKFTPDQIIIIGDAENDIKCAKGYGAVSLAVNTGKTTREQLESLKPDFLFPSLANMDEILTAIFADHAKALSGL
jgi:phosphoglycolate phosphatase